METALFSSGSADRSQEGSLADLLTLCATNLNAKASLGELPTVYGRDQEIEQILTSLSSPLKGRIVVTGAPRVGKTSIIQAVAKRIHDGECPESLKGSEVWSLNARSILRAFGVRDWHDKLAQLMELWGTRPDIILCVDALPTTLMAGATAEDPYDMAQFLLGQLQSSNNRILAEGRTQPVQAFLEAYSEYKHVLLEIRIPIPSLEVSQEIIEKAAADLTASQRTEIAPQAILAAIDLTRRFAVTESLPGKALDLIQEAIALQTEQGRTSGIVTEQAIIDRFGEKTGLPRILLTENATYDEHAVRRYFSNCVLGQDQAVDVVVQTLSLLRTRLNNPDRPMGVYLFIGPTGVGKTELARSLAQFLFGSVDHLVRFNMADYSAEWHTDTLFGSPHGFGIEARRGQFTLRMADHAFAVILLDEFEKAHPEVFQRFLQLFDEGLLINGASETINLRNSIVILTSNFGARLLSAGKLGFGPSISVDEQETRIREEMVQFFTPEFINRIDAVTFFKPLTKPVLREIAYRRVQEVFQREGLVNRGITVEVDDAVIDWVVEYGYSERYGARYLSRQIEKTVTYPLAQQLIRNHPPVNSTLRLFIHNDRVASALILPPNLGQIESSETTLVSNGGAEQSPALPTLGHLCEILPALTERIQFIERRPDIRSSRTKLHRLLQDVSNPTFWDDPISVHPNLAEVARLSGHVELVDGLRRNLDELADFLNAAELQNGDVREAVVRYRYLLRELPRAESEFFGDGDHDVRGAYLLVQPHGKRASARAWAAEIARMYVRWATLRGLSARIVGEEPRVRQSSGGIWLRIDGYGAYAALQDEAGIHRLVQPQDQNADKRAVIQALVAVWAALQTVSDAQGEPESTNVTMIEASVRGIHAETLSRQIEIAIKEGDDSLKLAGDQGFDELVAEGMNIIEAQLTASQPQKLGLTRSYVRYGEIYVHDTASDLRAYDVERVLNGELDIFLQAHLRSKNPLD